VHFAKAGETAQVDDNRVAIVGYSGGIILNHWYWGNLAFDKDGIQFAKKKTPILAEHMTDARIGVADKQAIGPDGVIFEGNFLANDQAQRLRSDMKQGFPMEASLYIPPSVVERVDEGEEVQVNGLTLKGPGTVFRKSKVKEVSICVFGADSETSAVAFNGKPTDQVTFDLVQPKEKPMDKPTMTADQFAAQHPDIQKAVFEKGLADGEAKERALFAELRTACGGDNELIVTCFAEGKTVQEALQMRAAKLEAANAQLRKDLDVAKTHQIKSDDLAVGEFKALQLSDNQAGKEKQGQAGDAQRMTDDQLKARFASTMEVQDQYSSAEAYIEAVRHDSNIH
jgi:hypothetical protein